jgi:hypothetical protein
VQSSHLFLEGREFYKRQNRLENEWLVTTHSHFQFHEIFRLLNLRYPETKVTTNGRYITSLKSEDLNYTAPEA